MKNPLIARDHRTVFAPVCTCLPCSTISKKWTVRTIRPMWTVRTIWTVRTVRCANLFAVRRSNGSNCWHCSSFTLFARFKLFVILETRLLAVGWTVGRTQLGWTVGVNSWANTFARSWVVPDHSFHFTFKKSSKCRLADLHILQTCRFWNRQRIDKNFISS